jgi:hypothetical protein
MDADDRPRTFNTAIGWSTMLSPAATDRTIEVKGTVVAILSHHADPTAQCYINQSVCWVVVVGYPATYDIERLRVYTRHRGSKIRYYKYDGPPLDK